MQRKQLAWILFPVVIVLIAVVTLVLSNFQEEAGIAEPGKSGLAAVAALAEAERAASGSGTAGYDLFSKALTVAAAKAYNMTTTNPAETRLLTVVASAVDCLRAGRETWQAELEQDWDPTVDGSADYWLTLHSGLRPPEQTSGLSMDQVRLWADDSAAYWLQKALALVE
jgi:hypothetical protein